MNILTNSAYQLGWDAHEWDKPKESNPFTENPNHLYWVLGWEASEKFWTTRPIDKDE